MSSFRTASLLRLQVPEATAANVDGRFKIAGNLCLLEIVYCHHACRPTFIHVALFLGDKVNKETSAPDQHASGILQSLSVSSWLSEKK